MAERAPFDVVLRAVVPVRALNCLILVVLECAVPEGKGVLSGTSKIEQHIPEHAVFKRQAAVYAKHELHQHRVFAFRFKHHVLDDGVHVVVHLRVVVPVEQIPLAACLAVTGRIAVLVGQGQSFSTARVSSAIVNGVKQTLVITISDDRKNIHIAIRNTATTAIARGSVFESVRNPRHAAGNFLAGAVQ